LEEQVGSHHNEQDHPEHIAQFAVLPGQHDLEADTLGGGDELGDDDTDARQLDRGFD
jgi:hypothetical protein